MTDLIKTEDWIKFWKNLNSKCDEKIILNQMKLLKVEAQKQVLIEVVNEAEQWDKERLIEVINKKLWELDK